MSDPDTDGSNNGYWRANLRLLSILMAIWFLASFGAGILFRDALDRIEIGGVGLGFWFAQQGAIYVFVILVFIYVLQMRRIDRRFGLDDDDRNGTQPEDDA